MIRILCSGAALIFACFAWRALPDDSPRPPGPQAQDAAFRSLAKPLPPGEPAGERPYEMVPANRRLPNVPFVSLDSLDQWRVEGARRRHCRARGFAGAASVGIARRATGVGGFTFRTIAAPGKGGDEALRAWVERQKTLGWRSGLYTNYSDFSPVNPFWDPDMVMRNPAGDLVRAWPR